MTLLVQIKINQKCQDPKHTTVINIASIDF